MGSAHAPSPWRAGRACPAFSWKGRIASDRVKRMPSAEASAPPRSVGTGYTKPFFIAVSRRWSGCSKETATSSAPAARIRGSAARKARSPMLRYGHQPPR